MKKITCLLLCLIVVLSAMCFVACGGDSDDASKETTTAKEEASSTEEKETESETTVDDGKVTYKVTVVDDAGNPVVGAIVQLCKDACVPNLTDDNGVAEFKLVEDNYDVKFAVFPEGYEYSSDQEVFNFENGKYELTITLKKIS